MTGARHNGPYATGQTNPWTPEREAEAERLYAEGLSASKIAEALGGCTRNSIIGKLHRMGVTRPYPPSSVLKPGRKPRVAADAPPIPKRTRARPAPAKPLPAAPIASQTAPEPGPWTGGCKWPTNSWARGEGWRAEWCGERREVGKPYCGAHAAKAYAPRPQPKSERVYVA